MAWWMWMVLGFVLLIVESFHLAMFMLFFGVAALVVGLLTFFGLNTHPTMQWVLFSAISIVSMLLFRKPLLARFKLRGAEEVDRLENEYAVAMEDIANNATGKAELRGSPWSAKNVGEAAIPRGQRVRVERVEGLILHVRAD
jgi:inner membrane protein